MRMFLKSGKVFGAGIEDRPARNGPGTLGIKISVALPAASYDGDEPASFGQLTEQLLRLLGHAPIEKNEVVGFLIIEALIERAMMD